MRADLPGGTVTFLFTDIAGSTRLLHALGPDAYGDALAEHRRLLREAFAAHGGVEVDTQGDAFLVAFPTATGAAAAATAAHAALAGSPIEVRMGLHTGAPNVAGEGYVGIDVHRGARVGALAHGGQTVASPSTAALLGGERLIDLGAHRLKDFDGATRIFQLGAREFPPLRSPGSVDLPSPPTRFLGRERELFEAVSLVVDRDPRVLTVVGPGGTGKTRFAIELARLLADEADGATLFVPLAPVHESALVLPAIAERLGASGFEPAALAAAVGARRTHLVVDNLEHLLPEAATGIAELVAAAPALRLLATSREPLRIGGEVEYDLPPLADDEAVALFLERAHAVRPDIERTDAVAEICRRLDHLPLALELAAARTKLLAPAQLLERLSRRLDLLKGTRDADARHATLRATIAWSYDLLEPEERELFARLSVFAAGCTLESAEAVAAADLDTLASLLDRSLLRRRTGRLGEERYWMLETIREFAGERLDESGAGESTRRRHAERMLEIAHAAGLSEDSESLSDLASALAERDDLRAALDWGSENDITLALELAVALENFWNAHAQVEGARRLGALLDRSEAAPARVRLSALRAHGGALDLSGKRDHRRYEEALVVARELGDERAIAALMHRLAMSALVGGDHALAKDLAEKSMAISNGRFLRVDIPNYSVLGQVLVHEGRLEEGMELILRGANLSQDIGWDWWRSGQLDTLAQIAISHGDSASADRHAREALGLIRDQENRHWALYTLSTLARVALEQGDLERAGTLWGAVEAETLRSPDPGWEAIGRERYSGPLAQETRDQFVAACDRAGDLDLWDAVAVALDEEGDEPQTVP